MKMTLEEFEARLAQLPEIACARCNTYSPHVFYDGYDKAVKVICLYGQHIVVVIARIRSSSVKLGVIADGEVTILREELLEKMKSQGGAISSSQIPETAERS